MEDYAYLFNDSAAAWLQGRGDARFVDYERYYQSAHRASPSTLDLEDLNDHYAVVARSVPPKWLRTLGHPAFGKTVIALFAVWCAGQIVPSLALVSPNATGVGLIIALIGMRIYHRTRRR